MLKVYTLKGTVLICKDGLVSTLVVRWHPGFAAFSFRRKERTDRANSPDYLLVRWVRLTTKYWRTRGCEPARDVSVGFSMRRGPAQFVLNGRMRGRHVYRTLLCSDYGITEMCHDGTDLSSNGIILLGSTFFLFWYSSVFLWFIYTL